MSAQRSVLVVDDDEQLLRLMVCLLDVSLAPGGGAAEWLPLLHARAPGLEVLLMSGDALPEPLESELSRRGGRFLRKPFAPKALLRLIAEPGGPRVGGDLGDPPAGTGH